MGRRICSNGTIGRDVTHCITLRGLIYSWFEERPSSTCTTSILSSPDVMEVGERGQTHQEPSSNLKSGASYFHLCNPISLALMLSSSKVLALRVGAQVLASIWEVFMYEDCLEV